MGIVTLKEPIATNYRNYLNTYRNRTGKVPKAPERVEALACAQANARDGHGWQRPWWVK